MLELNKLDIDTLVIPALKAYSKEIQSHITARDAEYQQDPNAYHYIKGEVEHLLNNLENKEEGGRGE